MIANLYRDNVLVGSLELGGRKPYSLRITYSLSGEVVELGSGLERSLVPPTSVTEIYTRRLTVDFDTKRTTVDYVLSTTIEPSEDEPKKKRSKGAAR